MRGVTVVAPDGVTWRVQRRWMPRLGRESAWDRLRRRFKRARKGMHDLPIEALDGFDAFDGLAAVGVVILAIVAFFFVIPALIALLDLFLLLLLSAIGVLIKTLFRRPWLVDAAPSDPDREGMQWKVVGWGSSGQRVQEVAEQLRAGLAPAPGLL